MSLRLREEELRAWGRELGRAAAADGVFVALYGPLGSGKSTLARAAADGAGAPGPVQSPTYTLVHEHRLPGGRTLFHVDLYRLEGEEEVAGLGWDRILGKAGPVFVEWADRAPGLLPRDRWDVALSFVAGAPEEREVSVEVRGEAPSAPSPRKGAKAC